MHIKKGTYAAREPDGQVEDLTLKLHGTAGMPIYKRRYAGFYLPDGQTNQYEEQKTSNN